MSNINLVISCGINLKEDLSNEVINGVVDNFKDDFERFIDFEDVKVIINDSKRTIVKISKNVIEIENHSDNKTEDKASYLIDIMNEIIDFANLKKGEYRIVLVAKGDYVEKQKNDRRQKLFRFSKFIDKKELPCEFREIKPVPLGLDFMISFDDLVAFIEIENMPDYIGLEIYTSLGEEFKSANVKNACLKFEKVIYKNIIPLLI